MALADSLGQMAVRILENFKKITSRARESTSGPTAESTTASGKTIKWRVMACSHGPTAEDMKANTLMIRKKAKAYFSGKNL